ncbi:hypothetical protein [Bacillus sp. B-jedd]|uniref:hypothetical protein n=1 Tax=Bacillus sp. B-jedd TaxID=1476857 RepID=UPI0005155E90|nr:hypothetical protein [Bacillus sp. B-jedd]CEG27094.1 hypothetical protein BN1002_01950 [Bacillus sp. B-jedd]
MEVTFRQFLDTYLEAWRSSSLTDLKEMISPDYQAREITGGEIDDFGYKESINGWEQGFQFVKESNAKWIVDEISIIPLRADESMVILSATMMINENKLETANLLFQTFKRNSQDEWKLVRSHIEAGIPNSQLDRIQFKSFVE